MSSLASQRSPRASLTAVMRSCSRDAQVGLAGDRDAGAAGDVVDHDGQVARVGDRGEVRDEPGLRRLVVVGRHGEHGVGAGLLGHLRRLDALGGVVAAGAGDDDGAVADGLDDGAQQLVLLVGGGGRRLARRARHDEAVVAVVDEVRGEGLSLLEVDGAVVPHRGDHRREDASECGCSCHGARLAPAPARPPVAPTAIWRAPARGTGARARKARHYSLGGPSSASHLLHRRSGAGVTARTGEFFRRDPPCGSGSPLVGHPGEAVALLAAGLEPVLGVDLRGR